MANLGTTEALIAELDDLENDDLEEIESVIAGLGAEDSDLELFEDDELAFERRRGRRRGRGGRTQARNVPQLFEARLQGLATKQEVKALATKTRAEIQRVDRKATSNTSRLNTQSALNTKQNKAIKAVRKDVEDTKQLILLTSLLGSEKTLKLTQDVQDTRGDRIVKGTDLKVEEAGDKIDRLLPFLLLGGLGGKGGGLMDNPLMLVLLLGVLK